jgi:peroxiredoxin
MKKHILFILIAAAVLSACAPRAEAPAPEKASRVVPVPVDFGPDATRDLKKLGFLMPTREVKAPDFNLKSLDGEPRSLSSFRGKLVFLNFWGAWCQFCRIEMPSMQRLYDRCKAAGLEIVAVDVRDTEEEARAFIQKNKHTFPVLLDTNLQATGTYGVGVFPTTFLIDREGYLRAMINGGREWDSPEVIAVFSKILSGKQAVDAEGGALP